MKKIIIPPIIILVLGVTNLAYSQNLVSNPSFESFTVCPSNQGQINLAAPWNSTRGTVDYYHSCSNNPNYSTPLNSAGIQTPRTGNGYAGFFCRQGFIDVREYLSIQLSAPLIAGQEYCVYFFVSLADDEDTYDMATNDIGAFFTDSLLAPNPSNFAALPFTPQIENSNQILSDRTQWQLISGSFIASGGEQYMIIGSFHDNASQNTTPLGPWGGSNEFAYYFIEDVTVINCQNIPLLNAEINGSLNYCPNDTITLIANANGGVPGFMYLWNGVIGDSVNVFLSNSDTTLILEAIDAIGNSAFDTVSVTIQQALSLNINSNLYLCEGESYTLEVSGAATYQWENGASGNAWTAIFEEPTSIYVIGSTNGCQDTVTALLFRDSLCDEELILPNVFSPNNDGLNDALTAINNQIKIERFEIYNRWGYLIYEGNGEIYWDGKVGENYCTDGVYYIVITRKSRMGELVQTGHYFTLLK